MAASGETPAPPPQLIRILATTDFSPGADVAVRWAAMLAQRFEAELILLNVIDLSFLLVPSLPAAGPIMHADYDVLQSFREEAKRQMALVKERYPNARSEIREGSPRPVILEEAVSLDASVVVMGTHGRSGIAHLLLGSVAEHVVRHSKVPVLTVPLPKE
jgi:universal stress protein A